MCTCFGTAFCAASASTFNQIFEIERDKQMNRTKNRPLPSNKVTIGEAAALGISTGTLGAVLLYSTSHPLTAALGVANIALYSGAYTYSKRVTEWNTWIGSVVGAIPPVMGYVAATNGHLISAEPMLLASTLFLWQFPHFFHYPGCTVRTMLEADSRWYLRTTSMAAALQALFTDTACFYLLCLCCRRLSESQPICLR